MIVCGDQGFEPVYDTKNENHVLEQKHYLITTVTS